MFKEPLSLKCSAMILGLAVTLCSLDVFAQGSWGDMARANSSPSPADTRTPNRDTPTNGTASTGTTGGTRAGGTTSSATGGDRNGGSQNNTGGLSFGPGIGSAPSPCNGCGQANLGFGPNIGTSNPSTGSNLGYSMGTSVSVGGTNTGATSGGSGGSGNAGGSVNGGYSMGTPVGSSAVSTVVNSVLMGVGAITGTTALAQSFAAGLQAVATRINETVTRVAETAARTINVHVSASAAGYRNMVNSASGTIGAGSVGYQEALDAAYYRGVRAYYDAYGIVSRVVPTGPMARIHGPFAVARDPALQAIDDRFNAGSISVVGTELGYTQDQMIAAIGPAYQNLSRYEQYGVLNSTVVAGDLTGTGYLGPNTYGSYNTESGVIAVDIDDNDAAETLQHEARHAADYSVRSLIDRALSSSSVPQSVRDLAEAIREEIETRTASTYYTDAVAQQYPTDYAGSIAYGTDATPRTQRAQNFVEYAMSVTETIAFNSTPAQQQRWAERIATALGITQSESMGMLNDFGQQYQQDEVESFIDAAERSGL